MKTMLGKAVLMLLASTAPAAMVWADQQSREVLGKIDHAALIEAVPGIPATAAEAGKRAYGTEMLGETEPKALDSFYAPFQKRLAAARDVIKEALANRQRNREELAQRTKAQAEGSPIVSRMGGTEKIAEMSEEEQKQAAARAVGSYQQSLSGAPPNSGGGMQALMQRMMSDPAYQERFEKMSKAEQEAELRKYMGPTPPAPTGKTAAERKAEQATSETAAVVAGQNELGAILQRMRAGDAEFATKDKAILASPGGHDQIAKDINAKIAKLPVIGTGEAGDYADPAKVQALQREQAIRDRTRATWELQQRTALFAQRKAQFKQVATDYAGWVKKNLGLVTNETAQLLDDSKVEMALDCEEQMIGLSEDLAKYTAESTRQAAYYEWAYQKKMSEPAAH